MYSKILPKTRKKLKKRDSIEITSSIAAESISKLVTTNSYREIQSQFIESIKKYGVNERGEKLILKSWYLELLGAIADFRFGATYVSGISQNGKTVSHTNLVMFCLIELGLNVLWSYDLQASLNIQVPSNFRPVADGWLLAKEIKSISGARNNTIFQVDNATAQFTYVSTTSTSRNNNGAAAGGIAVGVSRDIIFKEERSQYPIGADAPLARRMDAGRVATKPEREFGTPGGGAGIEAQIEDADYYFYPHTVCPSCELEVILNPKGCLLKQVLLDHPIFKKKPNYLSATGRPIDWYYHDPKRKIASAYFACPHCKAELKRICDRAYFKCLYTGYTLAFVNKQLPSGIPSSRIKAGFNISPLLKETKTNRAAEIIEEGLNTSNPIDWQQQMLGCKSESGENSISIDLIRHAIASYQFLPQREPEFKLGGIDCGRGQHWLVKVGFYLPKNYHELNLNQILEQTIRYLYFAGDVTKIGLSDRVNDLNFGIIDNEPDRDWSARFCNTTGWQMADQRSGLKDVVTKTKVLDGGVEYPCWLIRNEKFLKQVLTGFVSNAEDNYPLYRLDNSFAQHLSDLKSDRNPLKHLMAMSFDPMTGKWIRPDDHVDDIFYALAFSEVAFYLSLMSDRTNSGVAKWI